MLNHKFIFAILAFFCSINFLFSQNYSIYKVIKIDSTTLAYDYIIKVNSHEEQYSQNINILSRKEKTSNTLDQTKIKVGESYDFILTPCYEIIDKRHGKDSVCLTPAFAKNVYLNNEIFISNDYSTHPYTTKNLKGLTYVKEIK